MPSRRHIIGILSAIFVIGLIAGAAAFYAEYRQQRSFLEAGALHNALAYPVEELTALTGTTDDLGTKAYERIVHDTELARDMHPAIGFVSLLRYFPDSGRVVCLAAAGPLGEEKHTPHLADLRNGTADEQAVLELVAGARTAVALPHRQWLGKYWVSGYARTANSVHGNSATSPIDVFRYDIDLKYWAVKIAESVLVYTLGFWLLPTLPFLAYLLGKRHKLQALQIAQLSEAIEQVETAITIIKMDGTIKYVTPALCRLMGYTREELYGRTWQIFRLITPPPDEIVRRSAMLREGLPVEAEWDMRCKNGNVFPAHLSLTPVRSKSGKVHEVVIVINDITNYRSQGIKLQQEKERAEKADLAKELLMAAVTEEVNTPLNNIVALAKTLNEKELNPEQADYLAVIRRSSSSLARLTTDIRDLSLIESGLMQMPCSPIDPRQLINDTLGLASSQVDNREITFSQKIASDVPRQIVVAGERLQQVLLNLVGNAIKFTQAGQIEIRAKLLEPKGTDISSSVAQAVRSQKDVGQIMLLFSVSDTGIGISAEDQRRLFRPFWQVDSTNARRYGGAGLGLAISRRLVNLLGGEISVESELGCGATFHFSICCTVPDTRPQMSRAPFTPATEQSVRT